MLLATEDGLYRLARGSAERICCRGAWLVDAIFWRGHSLLCSPDSGVLDGNGRTLLRGECWRLVELGGEPIALLGGPLIVDVESGVPLGDYSGMARERGWYFPESGYRPHFTDVAIFKGLLVAATEVGNLMAGRTLGSLKPTPLFADQHVFEMAGERLLVGTAVGIYVTVDLEHFTALDSPRGYVHGLLKCGGRYVAQVRSPRPLWVSDDGLSWENLPAALEMPTFGSTNIACVGDILVYASTTVHQVDLREGRYVELPARLPMVYRIIPEPTDTS